MEPTPDPRPQQSPPGIRERDDAAAPAPYGPFPAASSPRQRPDEPDLQPEPELQPLDPRVKGRWWVGGALALLQLLVPLLVLDLILPHPLPTGRPTLAVLAVGAVLVAALPPIRYRRWRYALRRDDLWIRFGLLTVTVSVIPYRRLQFVDTRQSPIDRLFGLAELVVHTAALGTSGRLPGLDVAQAEHLREVLAHVAPDDDAV